MQNQNQSQNASQARKDAPSSSTSSSASAMRDNVNQTAGAVKEEASDLYASAKEVLGTAGNKISDGYQAAAQEFRKVGSQAEGMIKQNPLVAIGVAATLGWAVGRFLSSRSSASDRI